MTILSGILLFLAAFGAGAVNAVAGGGTLLAFPTLLALGLTSVQANATSTVGLVPGSLASAWAFRRELGVVAPWLKWLVPMSFLGGALGAVLLLVTPTKTFDRIVPWLILGATLLFACSPWISKALGTHIGRAGTASRHTFIVVALQLVVSIYGGYFGAGMGIMMLAALALLSLGTIHEANGLKAICGAAINGVAAGIFLAKGLVDLPAAGVVVVGSIVGGVAGAEGARRIGTARVRGVVIAAGIVAAVAMFRR